MAKAKREATKKSAVHLWWFDDPPKSPSARRAARAAKRAARVRVRPLAGALPKPARPRPDRPRPAPAPGLKSGIARALIDRSRIRTPRPLLLPSRAMLPRRTLVSWLAPR